MDLASVSSPSSSLPLTSSHTNVAWHKATCENLTSYCKIVVNHLPQLPDSVVDCCDPFFTSPPLSLGQDKFCDYLTSCLYSAAHNTLPHSHSSCLIAGWNSAARELKDKADFWHRVWKQAGSPSVGVLHQLKKSARSRYKYEV